MGGKKFLYVFLQAMTNFVMDHEFGLTASASQLCVVLVLYPLIALMVDQVQSLRKWGVRKLATAASGVPRDYLAF